MTLQVDIVFTDRALTTAPALQQLRLRLDQYQPRSSPLPGLPTAMFWQTGDLVKLQGVPQDTAAFGG